jgi:hypothetical protein
MMWIADFIVIWYSISQLWARNNQAKNKNSSHENLFEFKIKLVIACRAQKLSCFTIPSSSSLLHLQHKLDNITYRPLERKAPCNLLKRKSFVAQNSQISMAKRDWKFRTVHFAGWDNPAGKKLVYMAWKPNSSCPAPQWFFSMISSP